MHKIPIITIVVTFFSLLNELGFQLTNPFGFNLHFLSLFSSIQILKERVFFYSSHFVISPSFSVLLVHALPIGTSPALLLAIQELIRICFLGIFDNRL